MCCCWPTTQSGPLRSSAVTWTLQSSSLQLELCSPPPIQCALPDGWFEPETNRSCWKAGHRCFLYPLKTLEEIIGTRRWASAQVIPLPHPSGISRCQPHYSPSVAPQQSWFHRQNRIQHYLAAKINILKLKIP